MTKCIFTFVLLFWGCTNTFAQLNNTTNVDSLVFKEVFIDAKSIVRFYQFMEPNDWLITLGAASIAFTTYQYDQDIANAVRSNDVHVEFKTPNKLISLIGGFAVPMAGISAIYVTGNKKENEYLKQVAFLNFKTLCFSSAIARIPKVMLQRHRPQFTGEINNEIWEGPMYGLTGNYTFPSGHTMNAFALAALNSSLFPEKKGLKVILYSLASLVAVSRVMSHEHWASDVVVGAAMGYGTGKLMYKINSKGFNNSKKSVRNRAR